VDSNSVRGGGRVAVGSSGGVMAIFATVVDGVWVPVDDGRPRVNPRVDVIDAPISDIDQIVQHLAQVVRLAQDLSDEDQRRVRDFVRAALATLEATTSLPRSDQKTFERALRGERYVP
jgi:hypothetical protein